MGSTAIYGDSRWGAGKLEEVDPAQPPAGDDGRVAVLETCGGVIQASQQ